MCEKEKAVDVERLRELEKAHAAQLEQAHVTGVAMEACRAELADKTEQIDECAPGSYGAEGRAFSVVVGR